MEKPTDRKKDLPVTGENDRSLAQMLGLALLAGLAFWLWVAGLVF